MLEPLHIVIDTREQSPWAWAPSDAVVTVAGLAAGDYALDADTERPRRAGALRSVRFALERKSLDDFIGTISGGWERFQRELVRMEAFPARVVVVEGDFAACCFREVDGALLAPEHAHPALRPAFVARRIAELTMQGVSVLFAGDAQMAAGLAYRIFRRRADACQP